MLKQAPIDPIRIGDYIQYVNTGVQRGVQVRTRIAASPEGGCLFANCLHVGEPSCAVGTDWDRYPHYLGLLDEIRKREEVEKRVLGTKRESDVRYIFSYLSFRGIGNFLFMFSC